VPNFVAIAVKPLPRYGDFSIFQDGGRRHLGFLKVENFNGPAPQEGRTASPCQISWRPVKPLPKYGDFNSNYLPTCPHNMVNFGPLAAEIGSGVWGTRANFNGFRVLAALLHDTLAVAVSQTLRR